jgi:branched-chain amino acid transport system permease protein
LWYLSTRTELGLAMRATPQDLPIADAMGINSHYIVSITFVIGSAIAAVAGILVGIYYNQVYPTMGSVPAYKSLALIVVGGLGSVPGAVIASLLLGVAETLLIGYANIPLPRDALAFIAMIAVLMWRSEGLMGSK